MNIGCVDSMEHSMGVYHSNTWRLRENLLILGLI